MKARRSWKFFVMALAGLVLAGNPVYGCAVCYGDSSSPLAMGLNWGIASLLGVVFVVLGSIAGFFIFLAKQSARASGQKGPSHSSANT
jgi:hypothetical protein